MSNPQHLSASQRRIFLLEQQLAVYQQMQKEYNALLNYLVVHHPTNVGPDYDYVNSTEPPAFVIESAKMRALEFQTIRTEISDNGDSMRITRCPSNGGEKKQEKSLIILPPGRV